MWDWNGTKYTLETAFQIIFLLEDVVALKRAMCQKTLHLNGRCMCDASVEYSSLHMLFKLHQYFGFSAAVHVVRVVNTLKNLQLHLVVFGKIVSLILDRTLQTKLKIFDLGMNCFHLIASFVNSSFRIQVYIQLVSENL